MSVENQNYEKLYEIIEEFRTKPGALIPVLHKAQEEYGYISRDTMKIIAKGLGVPLTQIYGVVTFYSFFHTEPRGKYTVSICLGTACYVRGADQIVEELEKNLNCKLGETTPDGLFTLQPTRCIGACGLAPVMTVNEDVYGRLKPTEIKGILEKYQA